MTMVILDLDTIVKFEGKVNEYKSFFSASKKDEREKFQCERFRSESKRREPFEIQITTRGELCAESVRSEGISSLSLSVYLVFDSLGKKS